ncbi:MAG TPA: hypothetical protein VGF49_13900, partial [Candidatus Solibacter sp.]
ARAVGLLLQRRERLHSALDAFVESVDDVTFTGDTILRAMRAYTCIDNRGRWTENPTQVQISTFHDDDPPTTPPSGGRRSSARISNVEPNVSSNVGSDIIDIEADEASEEDALEKLVKSLSASRKSMLRDGVTACAAPPAQALPRESVRGQNPNDRSPSDRTDCAATATTCAASPAQALPRDLVRGQNPNDRSPSDRTDCAAVPAQPAAPSKPAPDADGVIWHPRPDYPNQEISEPDAEGRVMYKIHITPGASPLPPRETDAQRAADLIYRSVIKKYGNP